MLCSLAQVSAPGFIKGRISVQVDVGDYVHVVVKHYNKLRERTARKVLKTKQPVYLEPLPAYEENKFTLVK